MNNPFAFLCCPRCQGTNIDDTDYEGLDGEEDTEGRRCFDCEWEGDSAELDECTP